MLLSSLLTILITIICLLVSIAFFTLVERKVMAAIQRRRGPNVVGFAGLLQPLADGLKAVIKESIIPRNSNFLLFICAPTLLFIISLFNWVFIPFDFHSISIGFKKDSINFSSTFEHSYHFISNSLLDVYITSLILYYDNILYFFSLFYTDFSIFSTICLNIYNSQVNLLFVFAVSSINIFGIIFAGWSSNSKYAFLGAIRSAAQMISYEVSLGLLIIPVVLLTNSLNIAEIIRAQQKVWFFFVLFPVAILFFISMLAETNRTPFDLPEAEAELVAGYNIEYASILFAMFFLGEYSNMLLMSALFSCLFLGGWLFPGLSVISKLLFSIKIVCLGFLFILTRALLPRYTVKTLLYLGWYIILPLALSLTIFISILIYFYFNFFMI